MKRPLNIITLVFASIALAACTAVDDKPLTAQDLFDRHLEQAFGPEGLNEHDSIMVTGSVVIEDFGVKAPVTIKLMAPDSRMVVVEVMGMTGSEGCHNGQCWSQPPGQGAKSLSGEALAFQLQFADFYQYQHLDQYYTATEVLPESAGDDTLGVRLTKESGDEDYYYFSRETGLLVASTIQAHTPMGKIPAEATYSEYRDFSGVKMPAITKEVTPLGTSKIFVEEAVFGTLTDADFKRPQ